MSEPDRTSPTNHDDAPDEVPEVAGADAPDEDVTPAFDIDLPPDEQGTAEAAGEPSG